MKLGFILAFFFKVNFTVETIVIFTRYNFESEFCVLFRYFFSSYNYEINYQF